MIDCDLGITDPPAVFMRNPSPNLLTPEARSQIATADPARPCGPAPGLSGNKPAPLPAPDRACPASEPQFFNPATIVYVVWRPSSQWKSAWGRNPWTCATAASTFGRVSLGVHASNMQTAPATDRCAPLTHMKQTPDVNRTFRRASRVTHLWGRVWSNTEPRIPHSESPTKKKYVQESRKPIGAIHKCKTI